MAADPSPTLAQTRSRVCDEPGCETHLSRYNEHDSCSLHQPMTFTRMRGKVIDP